MLSFDTQNETIDFKYENYIKQQDTFTYSNCSIMFGGERYLFGDNHIHIVD